MDNTPRKRETRTGSGTGNVHRRGQELGTGPVGSGRVPGSGSSKPGQKSGTSAGGGKSGSSSGGSFGSGRPGTGMPFPGASGGAHNSSSGIFGSGSGTSGSGSGGGSNRAGGSGGLFGGGGNVSRGGCGGGIGVIVVVIILIVVFAGRSCSGGGSGSSASLLSGLSGSGSSGSAGGYDSYYDYYDEMGYGSDTGSGYSDFSSLFGGTSSQTYDAWTEEDNTESLDTSVAAGSRDKYTQIRGGGSDVVTVMVYMCGADLESKSGMATSDISEMTRANIADNVNLLVFTGGAKTWKNNVVSNQRNQIYRIANGGLISLKDNAGSGAMTDPSTLADYISWAAANYPADRYELIFWDHGSGSVAGYGYDEKYPSSGSMSLAGINRALKSSDIKFDFIGFDTCLMGTVENALMLSNYADYLIASEETEPGIGWYYTDWLGTLSDNTSVSTTKLGKQIIDDFVNTCARKTQGQKATLSIVDLAELSNTVPSKLADFANDISENIKNNEYKSVAQARTNTREFAASTRIDQIDLIHFAKNIGGDSGEALAEAVAGAVKYNAVSKNMTNAYGLSIYFPYSRSSYVDSAVSTYNEIGMSSEYGACIKNFAALSVSGQVASGGTSSSFSSLLEALSGGFGTGGSSYAGGGASSYAGGMSSGDISGLLSAFLGGDTGMLSGFDRSNIGFMTDNDLDQDQIVQYLQDNAFDPAGLEWKTDDSGEAYLELSEEQWSLLTDVNKHLYFDDGEGYIDLGLDNIYKIDENGRFRPSADGEWLAINGQAVSYNHIDTVDDGENYTITGYVPAFLNGDRVKLILVFDNENPYGYIAGAAYDYAEEDIDVIAKSLTELNPGDTLDFLCDYYTYEGEYNGSYMLGDQMTVTDEMIIENVDLGDNTKTAYVFTDIYGHDYWTATL